MTSQLPRSRDHIRLAARLVALAEAHGCRDIEALEADVSVVIRIEMLSHQREIRSIEERWRRRLERGTKTPTGTQP